MKHIRDIMNEHLAMPVPQVREGDVVQVNGMNFERVVAIGERGILTMDEEVWGLVQQRSMGGLPISTDYCRVRRHGEYLAVKSARFDQLIGWRVGRA